MRFCTNHAKQISRDDCHIWIQIMN